MTYLDEFVENLKHACTDLQSSPQIAICINDKGQVMLFANPKLTNSQKEELFKMAAVTNHYEKLQKQKAALNPVIIDPNKITRSDG